MRKDHPIASYDYIGTHDESDAGWYAPNSIVATDIIPSHRLPGGGVLSGDLCSEYEHCLDLCISNTKQNIARAEVHLNRLITARENYER